MLVTSIKYYYYYYYFIIIIIIIINQTLHKEFLIISPHWPIFGDGLPARR